MQQVVYFEDMTPDFVAHAEGYVITEEEIIEFGQRFDPQPFHIDREAAKNSMFGRLVAPGALVICARSWLSNQLDKIPAYSAGLGVENMNLILPVLAGDVLRMEVRCRSSRLSNSRPDHGICYMYNALYNQRDEMVMELTPKLLVRTRDSKFNQNSD